MVTTRIGESCVACRPNSPRAPHKEIAQFKPRLPEWNLVERDGVPRLERTFKFRRYSVALAFTQRVGELADDE